MEGSVPSRPRGGDPSRGNRTGEPAARAARALPLRTGRPFVRYVVLFAAAALGFFALYWLAEVSGWFERVNRANAVLATALLDLLGTHPVRGGTSIALAGGAMQVVSECSAVYVAILFAAAVLAFPTTWRARGRGLALGLPLLFLVNVVRLVTLGLVLEHRASLLPFVHEYLWQVLFVLVVAALYLAWIEWVVPREHPRAIA